MNNIVISRFNEDIEWIDLIDKDKFNFEYNGTCT